MTNVSNLLFLFLITNSIETILLIPIGEIPKNDLIIDVRKGYALRRIGSYSPNVAEQIIHTFIPANDFCLSSPQTDICKFNLRSKKGNVLELDTVLSRHYQVYGRASYNNDKVLTLTGNDLNRVFTQLYPNAINANSKSIVHFFNNQLYHQKNEEKASVTMFSNESFVNYTPVPRYRSSIVEIVLKHIGSSTINLEYLSYVDIELFLSIILSINPTSKGVSNIPELLNIFAESTIGQSVFILRHCLSLEKNSLVSYPCLAISTLFTRILSDDPSTFSVFQLIPLPVIVDNNKFFYSKLPKVIGINPIQEMLITWRNEFDNEECKFSSMVICRKIPLFFPLAKSSCLSELFNDTKSNPINCEISKSRDVSQSIMEIDDGVFLFFDVPQSFYCQVHTVLSGYHEAMYINEPSIVHIPCETRMVCGEYQFLARPCVERRINLIPNFFPNISNVPSFMVPIRNLSTTMISNYQLQLQQSIKSITTSIEQRESSFTQIYDLALYILSIICLIIFTVILYIIRLLKYKVQRELTNLENLVQDIISV